MMFLPIVAYLPELHHDNVIRSNYAGYAQGANFGAQFIMGILMLGFTIGLAPFVGSVGVAVVSCVTVTIWIFVGNWQALIRMDPRAPGHAVHSGTPLCISSFVSIWDTTKMLYKEHPMAIRYLLCNLWRHGRIRQHFPNYNVPGCAAADDGQQNCHCVHDNYDCRCLQPICRAMCPALRAKAVTLASCFLPCCEYRPTFSYQPTNGCAPKLCVFVRSAGRRLFGLFYAMQSVIFSNLFQWGKKQHATVCSRFPIQSFDGSRRSYTVPLYRPLTIILCNHPPSVSLPLAALIMVTIDFEKGRADVAAKGKQRQTGITPARERLSENELVSPADDAIMTATL